MKLKALGMLSVFCVGVSACSKSQESQTELKDHDGKVSQQVIYGSDDRVDLYQEIDPVWTKRAASTAALFLSTGVTLRPDGEFSLGLKSYGASQMLCPSEPFFSQSTGAFCSGSLIAPDIIMTAGHCMNKKISCATTKFVFDYGYKNQNDDLSVAKAENVYSCKEVIHFEQSYTTNSDFALVRLDRPVVGRDPLPVRLNGEVEVGDALTLIGNPVGLPTKIAKNAAVRSTTDPIFFVANTDSYVGNSGSAVFNSVTGEIEGILVRGENDFVFKGGCYTSNVCKSDSCRGEDVTRVSQIMPYVDLNELVR